MAKERQPDLTELEKAEREVISHRIHLHGGNLTEVAGQIGCRRQTIYNKLKRYDLWPLVEKMRKAA